MKNWVVANKIIIVTAMKSCKHYELWTAGYETVCLYSLLG